MAHTPDIWGPGQLLGFSGVEGGTDATQPFVLHTGRTPASLTVRLPAACEIAFEGLPELRFHVILGDAISAASAAGAFQAAFLNHHTLVGEMPAGARLVVGGQPAGEAPRRLPLGDGPALWSAARGTRWALFLAYPTRDLNVSETLDEALSADLTAVIAARTAWLGTLPLPTGLDADRARLLGKAVSVMRVNVEAPCGRIGRRWTTPDRWPHRHVWLWDSAFHAVGWSFVDPPMAQDAALAMLEQVQESGLLPHMVPVSAPPSEITQPPLLAWAVHHIFQRTDHADWAANCVPYLFRYLEWIRTHRDRNGNDLPEWHIEGELLCRSGESGLDNSPRFDDAVLLDAVDFASFLCSDYRCLAEIAARLGFQEMARTCATHASRIAEAVNALLWSEEEGFYFDRRFDGTLSGVKAVSGFMPLFAGIAGPKQADALRRQLANPATFAAPFPVPSVSLDCGRYCKDMWRGPSWLNMNYLIALGLRRYGFHEDAARLREASLAAVQRWYEREGCLYEYYDSLDVTPPHRLDRKQRLITGRGMAPISDYGWTAALTAAWILTSA